MSVLWILVADRSRARILLRTLTGDRLEEVASFEHPESTQKYRDVVTDQPGRFQGGGDAHQSGDPQTDFKHETAARFAQEIVGFLEKARQQSKFEELALIAAPAFLGVLRGKLTDSLSRQVTFEVSKDYTHMKADDVFAHLSEHL